MAAAAAATGLEGGKKEEREDVSINRRNGEEGRGGRQEKAVGLINTLRRHGDRVVVESFRLKF